MQLLSSRDTMIYSIANRNDQPTINCAIGHDHEIPLTEFLSGRQTHWLYGYRFYRKGANLWTCTGHAATHLGARIDISDGNIIIAIDDIFSTPAKVVKSMRLALKKQWSRKFVELPLQVCVAEYLSHNANSKVITELISQESTLSYSYWHMARTQNLPVKYFPGSTDRKCRKCYSKDETTMHILNMCIASLKMMTEIHDAVLGVLTKFKVECDIEYDTSYSSLDNLKPYLVIKYNNSCYFFDITILYSVYDSITNMESAANRKIEKYLHLGYVIPFCVGYLGYWYSGNQILKTEMNFPSNTFKILKTASIKESI